MPLGLGVAGSTAISAGTSLLGSSKSSSASKSAAESSYYSTQAAISAEEQMYNQAQSTLSPYVSEGYGANANANTMAWQSPWGTDSYNAAAQQLQGATGYQNEAQGFLSQAAGMTPPCSDMPFMAATMPCSRMPKCM